MGKRTLVGIVLLVSGCLDVDVLGLEITKEVVNGLDSVVSSGAGLKKHGEFTGL